jgi:16S rRNA processing protein RimM
MSTQSYPLLCVGRITAAHGIRGEVRIAPYTATPLAIADYGPLFLGDGRTITLRKVRLASKGIVAALAGVADRNTAEALIGQDLFLPRDALPEPEEDAYYHADLIGLVATDTAGSPVGRVHAVHDFGAGDVLEITPTDGGETVMLPFTRDAVPVVSLQTGTLTIDAAFLEPARK